MKAIIYWPNRLDANEITVFIGVTGARVHSGGYGGGGYSVQCGKIHYFGTSMSPCEVVLMGDDEEDLGQ